MHEVLRMWMMCLPVRINLAGAVLLALLLVLLLVLPPQARAAQAGEGDTAAHQAQVQQWLEDLADEDAAVRDAARLMLMGLERGDLETLRQAVEQRRPLRPSQAVALREIIAQVYLASEPYENDPRRGFLGVTLADMGFGLFEPDAAEQPPGVLIVERVPGFSGYRMLRDGDIVLRVQRRRVVHMAELQQIVSSFAAGQTVQLEVLRQGQVVQVLVTLDPRPAQDVLLHIDTLKQARQEKFAEYWREAFAPVLDERIS